MRTGVIISRGEEKRTGPPLVHCGPETAAHPRCAAEATALEMAMRLSDDARSGAGPPLLRTRAKTADHPPWGIGPPLANVGYVCHGGGLEPMGYLGWFPCASLSQRSSMRTYSRSCAIWESSR